MSEYPTPEFGLEILRRRKNLEYALKEAAPHGRISFAKACIWSGVSWPQDIVAEAVQIAGAYIGGEMETLLDEGENIHWRKCANGDLTLLTE